VRRIAAPHSRAGARPLAAQRPGGRRPAQRDRSPAFVGARGSVARGPRQTVRASRAVGARRTRTGVAGRPASARAAAPAARLFTSPSQSSSGVTTFSRISTTVATPFRSARAARALEHVAEPAHARTRAVTGWIVASPPSAPHQVGAKRRRGRASAGSGVDNSGSPRAGRTEGDSREHARHHAVGAAAPHGAPRLKLASWMAPMVGTERDERPTARASAQRSRVRARSISRAQSQNRGRRALTPRRATPSRAQYDSASDG
jgi:hypothetical protein